MKISNCKFPKREGGYAKLIEKRALALRAAADRTENVEQLEAIVMDLEKLTAQAKRIEAAGGIAD